MNLPITIPSSDFGLPPVTSHSDNGAGQTDPPSNAEWLDPRQIMRSMHSALRGRYCMAFGFALIFAIVGIFAGLHLTTLSYQSQGLIRIASTMPPVLQETEQSRPMAMYDAFMGAQQMVLTSRRVLEEATKYSEWQRGGGGRQCSSPADSVELNCNE